MVVGSSTASPYLQYVSFVLAAGVAMLLIFSLLCFTVFLFIGGRRETRGLKWYQCLQPGDNHFARKPISRLCVECSTVLLPINFRAERFCYTRSEEQNALIMTFSAFHRLQRNLSPFSCSVQIFWIYSCFRGISPQFRRSFF